MQKDKKVLNKAKDMNISKQGKQAATIKQANQST